MTVRRDFYSIKKEAGDILRNKWRKPIMVNIMLIFLSVVLFFIIFPIDLATLEEKEIGIRENVIYYAINFLLLMPLTQGVSVFTLNFKRKNEANVGDVFDGYKYFFPVLVVTVIVSAFSYAVTKAVNSFADIAVVGTIISVVAFAVRLYVDCILSQVWYIICDGEKNPFKAMITSFKLMKGNVLKFIGLQLSFIMWFVGSLFTMGILMIWAMPYIKVTSAVFYDELIGRREDINEEEPKY